MRMRRIQQVLARVSGHIERNYGVTEPMNLLARGSLPGIWVWSPC
jgi:hypothetical protein